MQFSAVSCDIRKRSRFLKRLQRQFRALERDTPLFGKLREAVICANHRWRNPARYTRIESGHILLDHGKLLGGVQHVRL